MTKEQFEKLQAFEQQLLWAIKSNFIHMSSGEFNTIAGIYADVYKVPLTRAQSSCNTCRLKALKQLGEDYFKKKTEIEEKAKKAEEKKASEKASEKPNKTTKNNKGTSTSKGAGRPPKIDLNA